MTDNKYCLMKNKHLLYDHTNNTEKYQSTKNYSYQEICHLQITVISPYYKSQKCLRSFIDIDYIELSLL